jgi:hypothetical protein
MIFTFVCPQAGLDSNDANDASRAGDLRRAASAEADTLPSSSGMPTLRCRLSAAYHRLRYVAASRHPCKRACSRACGSSEHAAFLAFGERGHSITIPLLMLAQCT